MKYILHLYTLSEKEEVVDKSGGLTYLEQLVGVPELPCDIINPIISIVGNEESPPSATYCRIIELNRYYYIDSIELIGDNVYRLYCREDFLMSHRPLIRGQELVVSRNEFVYDNFIPDNLIPSRLTTNTELIECSGFVKDNGQVMNIIWTFYVIMATYGGDESVSINGGPALLLYEFQEISGVVSFFQKVYDPTFLQSLTSFFVSPSDYIVKFFSAPFKLSNLSSYANVGNIIKVGNKTITIENGTLRRLDSSIVNLYINPPAYSLNSFKDLSPYSKYELYLPFIGFVDFNSLAFEQYITGFKYSIDLKTGDVSVVGLTDYSIASFNPLPYFNWTGNIYVDIPLGSTNENEINLNKLLLGIDLATSFTKFGKGISTIIEGTKKRTPKKKMISKKGKRMIKAGVGEVIESGTEIFASSLTSVASLIPSGNFESPTNNVLMNTYSNIGVIVKTKPNYYYPREYNRWFGRPLDRLLYVDKIRGYTEFSDVRISYLDYQILSSEVHEIESLLEEGVYFSYEDEDLIDIPNGLSFTLKDIDEDVSFPTLAFEVKDQSGFFTFTGIYVDNGGDRITYGRRVVKDNGVWIKKEYRKLTTVDNISKEIHDWSQFLWWVEE